MCIRSGKGTSTKIGKSERDAEESQRRETESFKAGKLISVLYSKVLTTDPDSSSFFIKVMDDRREMEQKESKASVRSDIPNIFF